MTTALRMLPPRRMPQDIREVVRAATEGDQVAWEELVASYANLIWSVVRRFRFDEEDTADVVQNTWLRLATHLRTIRNPEALPKWLATTARHECLTLLRWRREQAATTDDLERPSDDLGPAEHVMTREVMHILATAMTTLSRRDARMLSLLMQSARPRYAEIASALDMPVGSLGPLRSRALGRLRAALLAADVTSPAG
ncbi:RNA polymerase sigma factor [Actinophytocola sp.]|uniref:RNA polymerase sigma factor n=1 Tax=Actinophytocola sp. TaxID=1872138 RepID=UPI00389AC973